jgi:hypothetical protein
VLVGRGDEGAQLVEGEAVEHASVLTMDRIERYWLHREIARDHIGMVGDTS